MNFTACILGLDLDYFFIVRSLAVFTITRLSSEPRILLNESFWYKSLTKMKTNNFLIRDCIGVVGSL